MLMMDRVPMVVHVPHQLSVVSVSSFFGQPALFAPDSRDLVVDFSTLGFVEPFPTLVLAHGLRQMFSQRERLRLNTDVTGINGNGGAIGYLKHMGFFRFIGLNAGKRTDEAKPIGERFLPMTTISRGQIENKGRIMQATLDLQAERLARIIFPGQDGIGPAMMLAYALREIMRNSFEHGQVKNCMALAQRWNDGSAEIAIADQGLGIFHSLAPVIKCRTPEEAVTAALLPGVSSQSVKGDSEWANSGFGLYVVSELGKRYGSFAILSSERILYFAGANQKIQPLPLHGTMVKLRVNTADAEFFPNILAQIVAEGEKIAIGVAGAVKSASKMSKQPVKFAHP